MKSQKVLRSDEALWEACKKEVLGKLGKFSARAMQQAVVLYKQKGGTYLDIKSPSNSLIQWNEKENMQEK